MNRGNFRKIFAIFMIAFMLFWSSLPSITMAFFITPGNAIKPGEAIKGGQPITGGQFIIPGEPISGGNAYQGGPFLQGGNAAVSGQPLIPPYQSSNGQWLIPNIAGTLPINNPIVAGDAISGGEGPSGGQSVNGGNASEGGNGPSGGKAVNGGDGSATGDSITGGDSAKGGDGLTGGDPTTGGDGLTGGDPTQGGNGPIGGNAPTGGDPAQGGTGPTGGNTPTGGEGPTSGDTSTNDPISGGGSSSSNKSPAEHVFSWLKDVKKGLVTIPNYAGQMLDGALSIKAGFKITDLKTASGNKNLFRVDGSATAVKGSGNLSTWLNLRYSDYLNSFENSKSVVKGKGGSVAVVNPDGTKSTRNYALFEPRSGSELKQKRVQGFLNEITSPKSILTKTKDYMKKNWVPFDKMKLNKDFFKGKSVLAKGNGIANVVLSVGYRLAENAADPSRTGTDLAAGITTDVLMGAGQTAISAGAGWMATAATAAAFGSVVPGVGTLVGAGVGLGLALLMSTEGGKAFSRKIEAGVKSGIEAVKNSKFVKGLKGLFGG